MKSLLGFILGFIKNELKCVKKFTTKIMMKLISINYFNSPNIFS